VVWRRGRRITDRWGDLSGGTGEHRSRAPVRRRTVRQPHGRDATRRRCSGNERIASDEAGVRSRALKGFFQEFDARRGLDGNRNGHTQRDHQNRPKRALSSRSTNAQDERRDCRHRILTLSHTTREPPECRPALSQRGPSHKRSRSGSEGSAGYRVVVDDRPDGQPVIAIYSPLHDH